MAMGRVGVDIERQTNRFDQDRETFGGADDHAVPCRAVRRPDPAHAPREREAFRRTRKLSGRNRTDTKILRSRHRACELGSWR
jgi:hypothetical protein